MNITKQDILDSKVLSTSEKNYLMGKFFPQPKITPAVVMNKKHFAEPIQAIYKGGKWYDKVTRVEETLVQVTEVFYNKKANEYLYTQDGQYINDTEFYF